MSCATRVVPRRIVLAARRRALEGLYQRYNRREFVHPDPLEFLYRYDDPRDREIAALVASGLAYGRVRQILKSVESVLERMPEPARFLRKATAKGLEKTFEGFKHRFTTGEELAGMLTGAKLAIEAHGSLEACFRSAIREDDEDVRRALESFAATLNIHCDGEGTTLVPRPGAGSACKRLNLYLRWMVRKDEVDPGGWEGVPKEKLVVPLDTHMFRICRALGMTGRRQGDMTTALEITAAFRRIAPEDPVKYDFALTRLGIRSECDLAGFLAECAAGEGE